VIFVRRYVGHCGLTFFTSNRNINSMSMSQASELKFGLNPPPPPLLHSRTQQSNPYRRIRFQPSSPIPPNPTQLTQLTKPNQTNEPNQTQNKQEDVDLCVREPNPNTKPKPNPPNPQQTRGSRPLCQRMQACHWSMGQVPATLISR